MADQSAQPECVVEELIAKTPKKVFRVVATDLDGTFLGENPRGSSDPNMPTEENREVFHDLVQKGVHVAMISGRSYFTTSMMMDHCGLDQYVISCHGATIYGPKGDAETRPLAKSWPLTPELRTAAAEVAESAGALLMLYTTTAILSCGRADQNLTFLNDQGEPSGEWWARVGEFPVPVDGHPVFEALPPRFKDLVRSSPLTPRSAHFESAEDLLAYVDANPSEEIFKALVVAEPARIASTLEVARERIPSQTGNVMGPFNSWIEIIHPDVNKAVAVRWLCDAVGTTMDHAITLGDGLNDLEMLREAGLGVAMANAVAEAKMAAQIVSQYANHESAVAKELKRLAKAGFLPR